MKVSRIESELFEMTQLTENSAFTSICNWWATMGVQIDVIPQLKRQTSDQTKKVAVRPAAKPIMSAKEKEEQREIEEAQRQAAKCHSLQDLKTAIQAFNGGKLKESATNTVVYDGTIGADLLVIGEGPGSDEDKKGLPFVGPAGKLLDNMLASINRFRTKNTLITNVNYWRPPGNRNPTGEELALCRPFVERMIILAKPKLILSVGAVASSSILQTGTSISRLRGQTCDLNLDDVARFKVLPTFHPAYLLRRPQDKSKAWRDLLKAEEFLGLMKSQS